MESIVAGTFSSQTTACAAVEQLRAAGIPASDISLIAQPPVTDAAARSETPVPPADPLRPNVEPVLTTRPETRVEAVRKEAVDVTTADDPSTTAAGAAAGGVLGSIGGLLVGMGALTIPGLGPILAAGPLAAALGGAAVGAATGGLAGALVSAGVPEDYASTYAEDLARGHVLLTVRIDAESQARVREILGRTGGYNLYPAA